jgi:hypothetical protein
MIEVLFVTRNSFNPFSWILQKFQRCPYTHVAIRFHFLERTLIVHANAFRVNIETPKIFNKGHKILKVKVIECSKITFLKYFLEHAGKQYGYFTIIGMGIQRLFNTKNYLKDDSKTFVCSEFVIRFLQKIIGMNLGLDNERDGPKELFEALQKREK